MSRPEIRPGQRRLVQAITFASMAAPTGIIDTLQGHRMRLGNEAPWDRIVRVIAGIVLLYLGWAGVATGTLGTVFTYFGFLPLITGLVGWCPAYTLFKCRTNKVP